MRTESQARGDAGIQLALFNETAVWKARFLAFCESEAKRRPTFKVEDIRYAWLSAGNENPHDHHVWGGMGREIVKRGLGVFERFVTSASTATHGHPVRLYRSLLCERVAA